MEPLQCCGLSVARLPVPTLLSPDGLTRAAGWEPGLASVRTTQEPAPLSPSLNWWAESCAAGWCYFQLWGLDPSWCCQLVLALLHQLWLVVPSSSWAAEEDGLAALS